MDTTEWIELRARQHAIEMTLAMLLAGAAMNRPKMLGKMHEALTNLVLDATGPTANARQPDMPPEVAQRFEQAATAALDSVFALAKNLK